MIEVTNKLITAEPVLGAANLMGAFDSAWPGVCLRLGLVAIGQLVKKL